MTAMTELLTEINSLIPLWVYAVLGLILWVLGLNLIKRILLKKASGFSKPGFFSFAHILLEAAKFPLTLIILASGIYLFQLFIPLDDKTQQASAVFVKAIVIISSILFLDRAVRELIRLPHGLELAFISKGVLQGLLRGVVIGFGILIFLDLIGISITPLLASLGIGSLAIGLALQDTLANFFAGIYITIDRPVRVGDFVKLESGEEGYIMEVGWRATRVQLLPNNVVIVPNQKLISSIVTNYNLPNPELAVLIQVGVHYDSDLEKTEEVTIDVARQIMKTVQGTVSEFDPFIRYHTFDQSSINFTVILRGKQFVDQYLIKHEFIKALHERYKKEGIVIPYPIRTLDIPASVSEALKNR